VALPVLSRAHHRFIGWCTDAECATTPVTKITADFFGSYHLYPCFEPLEYTITVVCGGSAEKIRVKYGETFTVTVPANCEATVLLPDGSKYTQAPGTTVYQIKI
jgi:hypothetical protein